MKTPLLVSDFLRRGRTVYRDAPAVVCGSERLTYGQVADRVDRFSNALRALGVGHGDVVAYLSFNCHRLLEAYYAVPQLGAILLPINIRLTPPDIAYILNDSAASTVVIDRQLVALYAPIASSLPKVKNVVFMGGDPKADLPFSGHDYETLVKEAPAQFAPPAIDEDDVAELFYTSGTTARPKGVMLTHRNLVTHAYSSIACAHVGDTDVILHSIPLFHVNGWGTPHTLTMVGGKHVMVPRFDPEHVLEIVEREGVTKIFMVPTMAVALVNSPSWKARDLSALTKVMFGGAATPPALVRALDERLPHALIHCGYGLSETSPILTTAMPKASVHKDRSSSFSSRLTAGVPLPGVEVEIMDESGQPLPHDGVSVGEICARGNTVFAGYWKQPEETSRYIVDGWFHTGDMGSIDDQGYVSIVDRKKDIIITGGENVASIEIEKAIYDHPSVLECAVIGVPDDKWGEAPAAIIVLKPGATLDVAELIEHARGKLAHFKVPKHVKFVEVLPKGGTGKILKRELRESYKKDLQTATAR
ncbi:MAG: fatty acid--CoA ligase [Candidatus Eremiobacteraeota bacterium]|nr:fatty acid--CoA ligase [Candidatus Eremiobacteraeota bacterium]MBV8365802.1 fatty acid--CoA ligase [Candidatus Eremiobacteraeota bacterium]